MQLNLTVMGTFCLLKTSYNNLHAQTTAHDYT